MSQCAQHKKNGPLLLWISNEPPAAWPSLCHVATDSVHTSLDLSLAQFALLSLFLPLVCKLGPKSAPIEVNENLTTDLGGSTIGPVL